MNARLAPILAGLAGLGAFFAELAPQGAGFPDTDDPSIGLAFIAAQPTAWAVCGALFFVASFALVVSVIAIGDRLSPRTAAGGDSGSDLAGRAVTVVGLFSAAFLFGHGVVRFGGSPLLYVQSLDQAWGEAAYLVTQFVGVHLFAQGGVFLLAFWIVAVAWLGVRRRVLSPVIAILAVLPGIRLLAVLAPWGLLPDGLWIVFMAAIPAAFVWLIMVGVSSADILPKQTARAPRVPEPAEATARP
jgi:hypothetical protein